MLYAKALFYVQNYFPFFFGQSPRISSSAIRLEDLGLQSHLETTVVTSSKRHKSYPKRLDKEDFEIGR